MEDIKLKILVVHNAWEGSKKTSAVDIWRIWRPINELKKHTSWQIDEMPTFIKGIEKYKDSDEFTSEELERAAEHLGKYDIIWSTYFTNPSFYTLLRVVHAKYGTKFVMDVDDDIFAIKLDNPVWLRLTDENVYHMQCMVRDVDYLTTTTEELAEIFRERRPDRSADSVMVIPNFIGDDYKHEPLANKNPVIGYFGGSSHFFDLDKSHAIDALERIMHDNKQVRFESCGMIVEQYLPKARHTYNEGKQGFGWINEVFPRLNYDISLAPIDDSRFSAGKSMIKWMEATRMGSAVIATNYGPYKHLKDGHNALLVENTTEAWYEAMDKLLKDEKLRKRLVENARKDLEEYRIENKWSVIANMFRKVGRRDSKLLIPSTKILTDMV